MMFYILQTVHNALNVDLVFTQMSKVEYDNRRIFFTSLTHVYIELLIVNCCVLFSCFYTCFILRLYIFILLYSFAYTTILHFKCVTGDSCACCLGVYLGDRFFALHFCIVHLLVFTSFCFFRTCVVFLGKHLLSVCNFVGRRRVLHLFLRCVLLRSPLRPSALFRAWLSTRVFLSTRTCPTGSRPVSPDLSSWNELLCMTT